MDFLAEIRRESDRFYESADDADPALRVPTCPDWSIQDLVAHVCRVHWFWATVVETRATDPNSAELARPAPPTDYRESIRLGRAQADRMISVLDQTDDATTVWTWAPLHQTVRFIRRHQVQEVALHRWDLQNAAGRSSPHPVGAEAASDSIDEMFEVTLPWHVSAETPLRGSVHVHCTDVHGEWLIRPDGSVEAAHAKGDVAVRGSASDLLLAVTRRVGTDAVEMIGEVALAGELIERMNVG